jgi:hypothetical protein
LRRSSRRVFVTTERSSDALIIAYPPSSSPKLFFFVRPVMRRALSLNPPVASDAGPKPYHLEIAAFDGPSGSGYHLITNRTGKKLQVLDFGILRS